jgi:hypothetical protein
MPTFSVLVPTYNQRDYLKQALDSLIHQSEADWEAIVVNDGSTDDTADVIRSYSEKDARIIGINKENGGTASALNTALQHSNGSWICWLSSDDLFEAKKLALHREYIDTLPDVLFFFSDFILFDDLGNEWHDDLSSIGLETTQEHLLLLLRRSFISGISICVSKELWQQTGNFCEHLRYAQDYDMWLRLLASGRSFFIPERTCRSRTHPQQGSNLFNEACVFDSGKAAIDFLNRHAFEDLFPHVDLSAPYNAQKALLSALQVAADPASLCYGFGHHPCLISRIAEWITGTTLAPNVRQRLLRIVKLRTNEVLGMPGSLAFKFTWWHTNHALQNNLPYEYIPVHPISVAQAHFTRSAQNPAYLAAPLKKYLHDFDDIVVPEAGSFSQPKDACVLLLWKKASAGNFQASLLSPLKTLLASVQQQGYEVILASDSSACLSALGHPLSVKFNAFDEIHSLTQTWKARIITLQKEASADLAGQSDQACLLLSLKQLTDQSTQKHIKDWLDSSAQEQSNFLQAPIHRKLGALLNRGIRVFIQSQCTSPYRKA